MRKFSIFSLMLASVFSFSQGRRANQSAVNLQYGFVLPSKEAGEFQLKGGYNHVIGDKGILAKAELTYQKYHVGYIDDQILPYEKYGITAGAGWSYENLHPFYVNLYAGIYGGMEKVNNGISKDPKYEAEIPYSLNNFIYGVNINPEIEVFVTRRFSVVLDYTQNIQFGSKFSKSNNFVNGGLKYYIN